MTGPVRVLLVDDEPQYRDTIAELIAATPDLQVAGVAGTGREAVTLAARLRPQVVLMDIRMPDLDGIEATERIMAADPRTRVLILTTFDPDDHIFRALRAGASGFVLKDIPPARLLEAIHTVAAGDALLAPRVTRRLIAAYTATPATARTSTDPALTCLTPREREVLTLITRGLSNAEIEATLYVTRGTLKTHVGRLLTKLGARDRAQLVIAGYAAGLADRDTR